MKFSLIVLATAATTEAFSFKKVYSQLRDLFRDNMQSCNRGNLGTMCNDGANCPPCWVKNGNKYDCYEYNGAGQCPWAGMIDRKKGGSKYPAQTCLYGNQQGRVCDTGKQQCPACWIKSGNDWGCFDKKNGQCEWQGMTDTSK